MTRAQDTKKHQMQQVFVGWGATHAQGCLLSGCSLNTLFSLFIDSDSVGFLELPQQRTPNQVP